MAACLNLFAIVINASIPCGGIARKSRIAALVARLHALGHQQAGVIGERALIRIGARFAGGAMVVLRFQFCLKTGLRAVRRSGDRHDVVALKRH
ncbi:MAG: hypothetical protein A3K04_00390 [Gallionellales bacterium RBG_16_56_9]|nr:MAG: hypothetical protein A3K04_00390 [Gallionellales bacterium RBG_16_56_9]